MQSKREALLTPHCEQQRPSLHGLSEPQALFSALQVPDDGSFVVDDVVDVVKDVEVVVPADEIVLLVVEVEDVDVSGVDTGWLVG